MIQNLNSTKNLILNLNLSNSSNNVESKPKKLVVMKWELAWISVNDTRVYAVFQVNWILQDLWLYEDQITLKHEREKEE